jgi:hypothetical protein
MIVLILLFLVACDPATQIRAKMWVGGNNEITRNVVTEDGHQAEEFLLTSDPKFGNFRCFTKKDTDTLIREALKRCKQ